MTTPDFDIHTRLTEAVQLHQSGRLMEAEQLYDTIVFRIPNHPQAWMLKGTICYQRKDWQQAQQYLEKAIALQPQYPAAWCNLGSVYQEQGKIMDAVQAFRRAIDQQPDMAQAHANLANALSLDGQLKEAVQHYTQALKLAPDYYDAWLNLGITFREMANAGDAQTCFAKAIALSPKDATAYHKLGVLLAEIGQVNEALSHLQRAASLAPENQDIKSDMGFIHLEMGRHEEAMRWFSDAKHAQSYFPVAESNRLFAKHFDPRESSESLFEAACAWGKAYAPSSLQQVHPSDPKQKNKVLHIGYVSADFRQHPIGYFTESVIAAHRAQGAHVTLYANHAYDDEVSGRLRAHATQWRRIYHLSDEALFEQIRADRIDILVDLSGHTYGNRLGVFARKPAPVQVTWLGYFDTTGMEAIDYILCDRHVLPASAERWFVEKPLRLPQSYLCFTPPTYDIPVADTPCLKNGYVTFGCYSRINKLTPDVLDCWTELLARVPNSRLRLKSKSLATESIREGFLRYFRDRGITSSRIECDGASSRKSYLQAYHDIDVVLDTFPYGGGTTTAEALWMGVPVICWPQERFIGRLSASILHTIGRPEWVCSSKAHYMDTAISLTRDPQALNPIRHNLRDDLLRSPLCDAKSFTQHLESLYRQAWIRFCES